MEVQIIGGGVIGLCSAYYLNKKGYNVSVFDAGDFDSGCSYGNAGMIVPSHFAPLASPGVIKQGIKWMFQSDSPFYIKPRLSIDLAKWMFAFMRSCTEKKAKAAYPLLLDLNLQSKQLYKDLSEEHGASFGFEERGITMIYNTNSAQNEEIQTAKQAEKLGIKTQIFSAADLEKHLGLKTSALGAIHYPGDAHLDPEKFMRDMISELRTAGVQFYPRHILTKIYKQNDRIDSLEFLNKNKFKADKVLFASGSWTGKILKDIGIKLLMQDGKGYSITHSKTDTYPSLPIILHEAKVAITPMFNQVRIGGTLEISNHDKSISTKRVKAIVDAIVRYFPEWQVSLPDEKDVWLGYRPCSPDGLPYLGKIPHLKNTFISTGHAMMGMSLGPISGKLISEIIAEENPSVSVDLLNPLRKF